MSDESTPPCRRSSTPKTKVKRKSHKQEGDQPASSPLELKVPIVFFVAGFLLFTSTALLTKGFAFAFAASVIAFILLLVQIPITIGMLYLIAGVLGISYGSLFTAVMKLAGLTMLLEGVTFACGLLGIPQLLMRFLLAPVSWFLFSLFFHLEIWETIWSILLLMLTNALINFLIVMHVWRYLSNRI